jgi:hypothetical protein
MVSPFGLQPTNNGRYRRREQGVNVGPQWGTDFLCGTDYLAHLRRVGKVRRAGFEVHGLQFMVNGYNHDIKIPNFKRKT